MKMSRSTLFIFGLILLGLGGAALALRLMAQPASALSGAADLQPTPPPFDAEMYVVRAYYDNYQMVHDLSTWTEPWEVYSDLGFVVLGVNQADLNLLQVLGFRVEIDEEATRALTEPRPTGPETGYGGYPTIPGFACYRTVEGTYETAEDIVTAHPTLAQWVDVGDSWEKLNVGGSPGYDMMVLVLTNQNVPGPKPKLYVTSSIHAREYTPAELMTRFAEMLVNGYGTDPDITWILDYHEIHLMLHANPDGRKWAESGQLWRKNTNNNYCANTTLRGADLNRNFYYQWGCCGGSSGVTSAVKPIAGHRPLPNLKFKPFSNTRKPSFPTSAAPASMTPPLLMPPAFTWICTVTASWSCGPGGSPSLLRPTAPPCKPWGANLPTSTTTPPSKAPTCTSPTAPA
ncbi:MAG: hypothetical protein Fur0022_27030 [Anaerolineales bacterium]